MNCSGNYSRNYATITDTSLATCCSELWLQIRYDCCRYGLEPNILNYIIVYINYWLVVFKSVYYELQALALQLWRKMSRSSIVIGGLSQLNTCYWQLHTQQTLGSPLVAEQWNTVYLVCKYLYYVLHTLAHSIPTDLHDKYFPIFESLYFIAHRAYAV